MCRVRFRVRPGYEAWSEPQVEDIDLLPGLFSGIGDLSTPRAGDGAGAGAFGGAPADAFGGGGGGAPEGASAARPGADFDFQIFRPHGGLGQT